MTNEELNQLICDISNETYSTSSEYIRETHTEEMNKLLSSNKDAAYSEILRRILDSYLRSAIELSTSNTITVLLKCGLVDVETLKSLKKPIV